MPRPRRRWRSAVAIGALAPLGLVACGGGDSGSTGSGAAPAEQPRTTTTEAPTPEPIDQKPAVPDVVVMDLATGNDFALASVVPSDRPVLIWFWTPH